MGLGSTNMSGCRCVLVWMWVARVYGVYGVSILGLCVGMGEVLAGVWLIVCVCVGGVVFVPIDKAFLFLPIAPHSRGCLLVGGWVPVRIKQDQAVATNPDNSICTYAHTRAHSCYTSDNRQRVCGVWSTHKFNPHPPALLESRNTKMSSGAHMCWNELRT